MGDKNSLTFCPAIKPGSSKEYVMIEKNTAFEENLRKRGADLRIKLQKEVADFTTKFIKSNYPEIHPGNFPKMSLYGSSGNSYDPARVEAHFDTNKNTDQMFEEIAMKRFEESLANLRWVFENQGAQ